ncbi:MAG TPA: MFS transporter [Leptospiraceae bacterium]|nr:MFS transporter [Leptospiraceae bacterium]HMW04177.1 MFS transporter [Leptospiraceae bacterium]HMX32709.1 MFS transporter [Leptospiraceae bacterium]HMY30170.1 MFS transporter [Leptospiraceae bacterium]HMZ65153.1 MFS transporter [Leptospiraceae bacterium]
MYKNLFIIFICQALVQSGSILMTSTNTMIGLEITGSQTLSTMPVAFNTIATLLLTIPASFYMARFGRKSGFILGILFALVGISLVILGISQKNFIIYCLGTIFIGFQSSFSTYFRFAAAEVVHRDFKSRAVSLVLASGVIAALIGPNLYKWGLSVWKDLHFIGGFILSYPLYFIAFSVILFLNTGKQATLDWKKSKSIKDLFLHTPLPKIIGIGSIAYVVMVLIMTATPLGMKHHHFEMNDITQIIQFHILGMFVPSFFTGSLIKRFGDRKIMLIGTFLFLICIGINFIDHTFLHFAYSLILLGIGWNFLYVGATTLLSYQIHPEDQPKAQAINDFVVTGFSAISIATSGSLHELLGWVNVNLIAIPITILGIIIIIRKK